MTQQDARERAWRTWLGSRRYPDSFDRPSYEAGWDAAKREDEQRIAELVAALERIATDDNGLACSDIPHCTANPHASDCAVGIALRALAGPRCGR